MGNISSRPDDGATVYLRDQNRLSISSVAITNVTKRNTVHIAPNAYPSDRVLAVRPSGDNSPIEFVQDPEPSSTGLPSFLLNLNNEDDIEFTFTLVLRQVPGSPSAVTSNESITPPVDTSISGLTFVHGSTPREVENLVTREFHADPNLHKNANVALVGDFTTSGSPTRSFDWTWRWKPPRAIEDRAGGWRNSCSVHLPAFPFDLCSVLTRSPVRGVRSSRASPAYPGKLFLLGFE
jgi:Arf-GAP/SH3 domain/ANK repeat/PH domain-containing protein